LEAPPFLAAPLEEALLVALDAPFEEALEAPPFLAAPLLAPLDALLEAPPFLAAPLDAPFEELFAAPLEALLLAAFFAVAMLF
jgi:hypothetical protein